MLNDFFRLSICDLSTSAGHISSKIILLLISNLLLPQSSDEVSQQNGHPGIENYWLTFRACVELSSMSNRKRKALVF